MKIALAVTLLAAVLVSEVDAHGGAGYRGPGGEVPPGMSTSGGPAPAFGGAQWGVWWRRDAAEFLASDPESRTLAWSSRSSP